MHSTALSPLNILPLESKTFAKKKKKKKYFFLFYKPQNWCEQHLSKKHKINSRYQCHKKSLSPLKHCPLSCHHNNNFTQIRTYKHKQTQPTQKALTMNWKRRLMQKNRKFPSLLVCPKPLTIDRYSKICRDRKQNDNLNNLNTSTAQFSCSRKPLKKEVKQTDRETTSCVSRLNQYFSNFRNLCFKGS